MRTSETFLRRLIRETLLKEGDTSLILPPGLTEDDIFEYIRRTNSYVSQGRVELPLPEDPRERIAVELIMKMCDVMVSNYKQGDFPPVVHFRSIHSSLGFEPPKPRAPYTKFVKDFYGEGLTFRGLRGVVEAVGQYVYYATRGDLFLDSSPFSGMAHDKLQTFMDRLQNVDMNETKGELETLDNMEFWRDGDFTDLPKGQRLKLKNLALSGREGAFQAAELLKSMGY